MAQEFRWPLVPTTKHAETLARADEIARAMGSPVAGLEHYFLGMLHDRHSWVIHVLTDRGLIERDEAEAAVMAIINDPGYEPPAVLAPPPAPPLPKINIRLLASRVAAPMNESLIGDDHAFIAIIRARDSVPARALAGLVDLDSLEAALVEARAVTRQRPDTSVILPEDQPWDAALKQAIITALPERSTIDLKIHDGRICIRVIGRGCDSHEIVNAALASLGRPALSVA